MSGNQSESDAAEESAPQIISPGIQRELEKEVVTGFLANLIIFPLLLTYFITTFYYVSAKVIPYEFIDEKFHIGQTLQYIQGHWKSWDPKITTPPGLYILGWFDYKFFRACTSWSTLTILRLVNFVGGVVILPVVVLRPLFLFNAIGFWPVGLMCFPLMTTYYYLYYTDVWSTIFILQSLSLVLTLPYGPVKSIWLSALCSGISCLFRQTNIIWTLFIMVIAVERRAMIQKQFNTHNLNNYLKLFIHSVDEFSSTVLPFALNFSSFLIFLILNKGITLGDKSNHVAGFQLVQMFYCVTFICVFSFPLWISRNFLLMYKRRCQLKPVKVFFELLGIIIVIRYFTKVHPFLLADNRHYTFYLFRRFIGSKRRLIKYLLMAPIYHFSTFVYMEVLRPSQLVFDPISPLPLKDSIDLPIQLSHISWTTLLLCTFMTIVPSPLFEPRYYILPFYFWRLFVTCSAEPIVSELIPAKEDEPPITIASTKRLFLELVWFMLINVVCLLVFVRYPFRWDTEQFMQRIIW